MDVILPGDQDFFEAISDCTDIIIQAGGGQITAYSRTLQEQSPVFKERLSRSLSGQPEPGITEQNGKFVLDLDCSYDTAHALFDFILSKGSRIPGKSASPAMLRELASVANEWKVQPLLEMVDKVLADQMHSDLKSCEESDPKTWQYAGTHIRERGVQMLRLALEAGLKELQTQAEAFVAANWLYLSKDNRLTTDLDIASLCRIHCMAEARQRNCFSTQREFGYRCGRRYSHPRRYNLKPTKSK